ncbi:translation factor GUF1 homolog, mitochondrial isoform X2 [Maniola jurtina]|uniref:translation factor GUF1 homolog, mitochondrial isoform X2 n=1 Tax=Maniola jurtina TaxID=191418 RepID=UPI001E68A15F|nr:translation factor GUF1 homolog, mitochondrial isoform X2 [Maniola jurtina]
MVRIINKLRYLNSRALNISIYKTRLYSSNIDAEAVVVSRIRNFSIVAHVDHGKSTLADRLLELTGAIKPGNETSQVLDQLQVVRSVKACQGVIFLVDANEGVQAQTVAVHSLAKRNNLVIIPTLNKVDLPRADPENTKSQLKSLFNIDPDTVLSISAKKGWGVKELLEAVILRIPPPNADLTKHFKATIIDTWHDKYRGVMCLAYIESGSIEVGQTVKWRSDLKQHTLKYLALLRPSEQPIQKAVAGQVVMVGCGPKGGGSVGDELLSLESAETTKVASAPAVKHMVYAGIFPADQSQHTQLSEAIKKLALNDSAVSVNVDSSPALGQGWRIGFLGLLHLDVFTQRLLQEHKAEAILTAPSVPYKIKVKGAKVIKQYKGEEVIITNPLQLPDPSNIVEYYEPLVIGTIITPVEYIGAVNTLCVDRRGTPLPSNAVDEKMTLMQFILPLSEVVVDFHDTLKSLTSGFASFDYQDYGFHPSSLVRMDILINGVLVDELTTIVHTSRLEYNARRLTSKLKEMIPRQMVQVAIQAVVNGKVFSRETLKAYRKDVTAKLYGGDVTRKKKLLKQQAEGKKKMRSVANIKIPRDTFVDVLKR